jgi:hypothetical protein
MIMRTLGLVLALLLTGCGYKTATFPDRDPSQVWSAMVTAAQKPAYPDWRVMENEVWSDPATGEIEVLRFLRRDRQDPGEKRQQENEKWKFQIVLIEVDPPTIRFFARQIAVPAHVWTEANRYFKDVQALLGESSTKDG